MPKKITAYIFIFLGFIGILDFALLLLFGVIVNFGNILPGIVGFMLIVFGFLHLRRINTFAIQSVWLKKIITSVLVMFLISFVAIESLIIASINADSKPNVNYIIILGAGLKGDQMTITLQNRVHKGLDFLKNNPDLKVIVTGGKGFGEMITEAEAMRRYLVKYGISEKRIMVEDRATSTAENFKFSKELIRDEDHQENPVILIVTSEFHMFRSKMLASRNGFVPYGLPSETWLGVLPNCFIREYFAVIKSFFVDR
ncbi:MAG: YdcF family protein [Desulfitobacteriaceae bacterium]